LEAATRKLYGYILMAFALAILTPAGGVFATDRGISVSLKKGKSVNLYKDYHALVVGISNYERWPKLPYAVKDAKEVATKLEQMGFEVKLILDPTSKQMKALLTEMVYDLGIEEDRGLLFYYAGHGETLGYIIPRDCPLLKKDPKGFATHAISMKEIESISLRIRAKHVLMLFDSCFSGSLFALVRAVPEDISEKSALPVRQYITAGREDEPVPDRSMFKRCLLLGLEGDADLTRDGYITGSELGMYLSDKVVQYTRRRQHPQYGKINNPDLDRGDFIFRLAASSGVSVERPSDKETRTTLSIEANVDGARVLLDGQEVGRTPISNVPVSPGMHKISVEKEGYETYRKRIHLEAARSMSLYVNLSEERPPTGRLFVETEPEDAKVRLLNIKQRFHQGVELEPGRYHVEVSRSGYETKKQWIELTPGDEKIIHVQLEREPVEAKPGETWAEPVTEMEFVWVPGGCFEMGSLSSEIWNLSGEKGQESDEGPVHEVCVDGFWIGKYEVTQRQWRRVMKNNPSRFKKSSFLKKRHNYPVESVTWNDAKEFIRRLNSMSLGDYEFRLPTEAEWEYACRAETTTARFWGDDPSRACEYANVADQTARQQFSIGGWGTMHNCEDGHVYTAPVGSFRPNGFELYDMLGNVWEWCEDIYSSDFYSEHQRNNPIYTDAGSNRVVRGDSWGAIPSDARCANRKSYPPDYRFYDLGFRLVRTP
jgi:formylglycine-generating enzyme required for sulfatase activity